MSKFLEGRDQLTKVNFLSTVRDLEIKLRCQDWKQVSLPEKLCSLITACSIASLLLIFAVLTLMDSW